MKCCIVALLLAVMPYAAADSLVKHTATYKVGPNPNAIAAGDLNGDGFPDIVTANTGAMNDARRERPANDECWVLESSASLAYTALPPLKADFAPYAVALANVDTLKAPDIIIASFMAVHHKDISLFRTMGEQVYEPSFYKVPDEGISYNRMKDSDNQAVFEKPGLTSVLVNDFNRDGFRDLIATAWCSDVLVYFPGVANTFFGEPRLIAAPGGPRDVRAADLDSDGELDLAVALYASNDIGLWRGDGKGTFTAVSSFSSRGSLPSKLQIADMNADGHLDIVVSHCYAEDSIVIFYGDSSFTFGTSQEILLGKERDVLEHEIRDVLVGDFDSDGRPDIAAACYGSGQVSLLINGSSDKSIPQSFTRENYTYDNGKPRALCAADFNQDGITDIGVALWNSDSVALLLGATKAKPEPKKEEPQAKEAKSEKSKKDNKDSRDSKGSKSDLKKTGSDRR